MICLVIARRGALLVAIREGGRAGWANTGPAE